jgi:hypothetical protein
MTRLLNCMGLSFDDGDNMEFYKTTQTHLKCNLF